MHSGSEKKGVGERKPCIRCLGIHNYIIILSNMSGIVVDLFQCTPIPFSSSLLPPANPTTLFLFRELICLHNGGEKEGGT